MKSKIFKRIISLSLGLILATSSISSITMAADNNTVSVDQAKNIAISFVASDIKTNSQKNWKYGVYISNQVTLYDLNNNPSAYLFEFSNNNKESGYIVISASKENSPIVEYSYTGKSAITASKSKDKATASLLEKSSQSKNLKSTEKYYYLGGIDYAVEYKMDDNSTALYDLGSSELVEVSKNQLKNTMVNNINQEKQNADENKEEWDDLLKVSNSNPPTSGDTAITMQNISSFENGFTSSNCDLIYKADDVYWINTSTIQSPTAACAPTAAVNIFRYWYARDNNTYSSLCPSTGWADSYREIFRLMKTDSEGATISVYIPAAFDSYFKARNIRCTPLYDDDVSWGDVTSEISTGNRPFLLNVYGHYKYSKHSVVGVGWQLYQYNDGSQSKYIRIVDGWSNTTARYIHFSIGHTNKNMVKLIL